MPCHKPTAVRLLAFSIKMKLRDDGNSNDDADTEQERSDNGWEMMEIEWDDTGSGLPIFQVL